MCHPPTRHSRTNRRRRSSCSQDAAHDLIGRERLLKEQPGHDLPGAGTDPLGEEERVCNRRLAAHQASLVGQHVTRAIDSRQHPLGVETVRWIRPVREAGSGRARAARRSRRGGTPYATARREARGDVRSPRATRQSAEDLCARGRARARSETTYWAVRTPRGPSHSFALELLRSMSGPSLLAANRCAFRSEASAHCSASSAGRTPCLVRDCFVRVHVHRLMRSRPFG